MQSSLARGRGLVKVVQAEYNLKVLADGGGQAGSPL